MPTIECLPVEDVNQSSCGPGCCMPVEGDD